MLLHAAREGRRHEEGLEAAMRSMTILSREAADVLRPFEPNAVTDVTGFGLLGHAHEMAERSGVRIELDAAGLPLFPGAREAARPEFAPAATRGTATSPVRTSRRTASRRICWRSPTTRRPRAAC